MKEKILIIDDEEELLASLDTHFTLQGFETIACQDPTKAIELLKKHKPQLVLLDINMPDVNGIELLKRIKQAQPKTDVIMMTAYTTPGKVQESWKSGASEYLLKPFQDLEEVTSAVDRAWDRLERWEDAALKSQEKASDENKGTD